jgi:hypothetical protein
MIARSARDDYADIAEARGVLIVPPFAIRSSPGTAAGSGQAGRNRRSGADAAGGGHGRVCAAYVDRGGRTRRL